MESFLCKYGPLTPEKITEVHSKLMIGRLEGDTAAQEGLGSRRVAKTPAREAEQMGRGRMVREHRQHRPARRGGLLELALPQELTHARHRALKLGSCPDHAPESRRLV